MGERILLIGSGGREHALAKKLSESKNVEQLFVAPGNAGTTSVDKTSNVALNVKDITNVVSWCVESKITFVVVGPEDPLALGIVDQLSGKGIPCFGPRASAAEIEASKDFAKQFMHRHNIPTARFKSFTDPEEACHFITNADYEALVVKASGLAAGKGVVVASTREEACKAAREMMTDKIFGAAGDVVVVEELLQGPEVSVLAFSDGHNVHMMPPSQDHKRLLDRDEGPNTGGMGVVCPYPGLTDDDLKFIKADVIEKTVRCMAGENRKYVGVLYAGLMLTKDGPKVLEFNCRFGDPETQSILSLLTSDLFSTMKACVDGCLDAALPTFNQDTTAVGVVVVSGGYPGSYKKGLPITGLSDVESPTVSIIHAGTTVNDGKIVTSGGRVLAVVAVDPSLTRAMEMAQKGADKVVFEGSYHRTDIGSGILKGFIRSEYKKSTLTLTTSYKDAGVDIGAGNDLVRAIKPLAKMTRRTGCDGSLGGFGGIFDTATLNGGLGTRGVLVASTWGVGLKLKYAMKYGLHFNVGYDLVANAVNHLLCRGAEPLFLLDYFATGRLKLHTTKEVVRGLAEGCVQSGCTLIGGETAEMPGMYKDQDYDVAGMAVGCSMLKERTLPRLNEICTGDVVIAIVPGDGSLRYGDFYLLDQILETQDLDLTKMSGFQGGNSLAAEVLAPSTVFVRSMLPLMQKGMVKSFVATKNCLSDASRLVDEGTMKICLDCQQLNMDPVFGWMSDMANVDTRDMCKVSSLGVAALAVVARNFVEDVVTQVNSHLGNGVAIVAGKVEEKQGDESTLSLKGLEKALANSKTLARKTDRNFGKAQSQIYQVCCHRSHNNSHSSLYLPPTFDLQSMNMARPLLVSGTDGVGTKLKIAQALNMHSTIGIDLVAMCVNDVLANGAEPVMFTSYLAAGRLDPERQEEIVAGIAKGCEMAGCQLSDNQLSILPSVYSNHTYDLGGFCVAAVDSSKTLPRLDEIREGDIVIGVPSSGIHSNGFSLVRRVVEKNGLRMDMPSPFSTNITLGQDLLTPTKIYVKSVIPAMREGLVKSFAHITGGGLLENIPRVMPPGLGVSLQASDWLMPPVFGWLQHLGGIPTQEMSRTFNCGLGAILITNPSQADSVIASLSQAGESATRVGQVVKIQDSHDVIINGLEESLTSAWPRPNTTFMKRRVGVLISGSGTNLQALVDHTQDPTNQSAAEIALVLSNKSGVLGLKRAQRAGIATKVINHRDYKSREEFDSVLHDTLVDHNIEIVCLAGFMRILTGGFVNKWLGRMLNVHPSLLPSFKGANAHKMVLAARVRLSGCSVHFVAEEVDAGSILVQESVPVFPNDTEHTLGERVKKVEHIAFPRALEMVARGQVTLGHDNTLVWNW